MIIPDTLNSRAREQRVRRLAHRHELRLEKSRIHSPQAKGYGGYRLVEVQHHTVVYGSIPHAYGATLDDIEHFLTLLPPIPPPPSPDEAGGSHDGL
jgi:hypothetical protein